MAVGYDWTAGRFFVRNSWGAKWGKERLWHHAVRVFRNVSGGFLDDKEIDKGGGGPESWPALPATFLQAQQSGKWPDFFGIIVFYRIYLPDKSLRGESTLYPG